ncbi:hypothetical protein ADL30_20510 [Streptomyces sp. NRRL S-1521]|nr:hypothetical protein ADL30_20510 [Streptomyces sp. NRRL S-1521]
MQALVLLTSAPVYTHSSTAGARVIYALIDPRDHTHRYLGQTPAPTKTSLTQAVLKKRPTAHAVASWLREVRDAGHTPVVQVIREQVPAADAPRVLREELTARLAAGAPLLNEQGAAKGRKLHQERLTAQRAADKVAAWAEMADALLARVGGPLPPGTPTALRLPDPIWTQITQLPDTDRHQLSFTQRWQTRHEVDHLEEPLTETVDALFDELNGLHSYGAKEPRRQLHSQACSLALRWRRTDRAHLEQMIGLVPWCMYAAAPWYRIAKAGRLVENADQFIQWLGNTPAAHSLKTLTGEGDQLDLMLQHPHAYARLRPETCLLATAAAHCGLDIPAPLHGEARGMLADLLAAPMLTQPMADLLLRLDPAALRALGSDVAPGTDQRLGLPPGTTAQVLTDLTAQPAFANDRSLRHAAWRAAGRAPTVAVPDYYGWSGPAVPTMRVVSATLVHAGALQPPPSLTTTEYVTRAQRLLAPNFDTHAARWFAERQSPVSAAGSQRSLPDR